ncbi:MAG: GntR family transcriptional regulator [Clostridiales bacterium]|nr:GntR family transcriptional regulator [Clostridiales bacterium]
MAAYPKYEMVKQYLRQQIADGRLQPGDRLPSEAELADRLGVSAITIKKALGDLSAEGVVRRVKGKGSFVSRPAAERGSHIVAMVFAVGDIEDSAFSSLILGAQEYLSRYDYSLLVECAGEDPARAQLPVNRLLEQRVDGLALYLSEPDAMLELIDMAERRRPVVMIDRRPTLRPCTYVAANNADGAMQAANHLLGLGHRRIGFVDYCGAVNTEHARYEGYARALSAHGVNPALQYRAGYQSLAPSALAEAVRGGTTAVFAVNDRTALRLIEVLGALGLRVPEDVSVVGFDNSPQARGGSLPLTSVAQSFEDLGRQSARVLLGLVRGRYPRGTQLLLGTSLALGRTTAPPRRSK